MKVTEQEMRGLLTGKCVPGNMKVNEELPAYLVRQFAALHEQVQQLAAENAALKLRTVVVPNKAYVKDAGCNMVRWASLIDALSNAGVAFRRDDGELIASSRETTATDAWLNEVRAQGGPSVQAADLKALMRFNDTCDDGEGYDIGEEAMNRLVELGLVAKERGKMRFITSFGMWVIAREQGEEVSALETQQDRDLAFQQKISQLRAGEKS